MVKVEVNFITQGITGEELIDFLLTMDDKDYKDWFPGREDSVPRILLCNIRK